MKLENTLSIPVAVEDAWRVLLDVERVAPCVPGATLTGSDGDEHRGRIKVKLGPIGLTYNGTVTFLSRDERNRVVVLEAGGREARGNGTAKALVTCRLTDAGDDRTDIHVETELNVTGKPAQFGRGTLAEVSGALMDRFAENLAAELAADSRKPAELSAHPAAEERSAHPAASDGTTAAPLDLIDATGAGALKRAVPIALAAALLILALGLRGRRRHHR
ncbi:SRPBCC family protein [Streptomyces sp. NL15-2K]|uniref:SRPBCC family protein n=1 Tax=Streptomyces sp. NL15-2K TaxID=376149 RepID=UPI000F560771|nr:MULTISPECIES: SRPBCC family protein [Actinomycetes]WKX15470.1 SRPBCC family protein [Kutzneria buriramensis]GCB52655.1 carbon monoxide dehydrogenase G protein [Streptomyces sp. NL15-2K]